MDKTQLLGKFQICHLVTEYQELIKNTFAPNKLEFCLSLDDVK